MQLKNLECQLAMAQLKRFLGGAKLSDEALEALESHLVECAQCQLAVQMQRQQAAEGPKTTLTHAVVETPAPTTTTPETAVEPKTQKVDLSKFSLKGNAKTLTLSIALGLVLVTMSALANDPTKLFGERMLKPGQRLPASTPAAKTPPAPNQTPVAVATTPIETPSAMKADPPAPVLKRVKPPVRKAIRSSKPKRTVRAARPTPTSRPKPAPKPAAQPGIRVYDESGKSVP